MFRAALPNWEFHRHPLLPNGHMQTLAGLFLPRQNAPYRAAQHEIELDDSDRLVLHVDLPANWTERTPSVLLIHGLTGCHRSTYMCRMTERLQAAGYGVFRLDLRGCGAGEELARYCTHCGRWADAAAALEFIAWKYPKSPVSLIGFSIGGAMVLNLLAHVGSTRVGNLQRSLAICPPVDLFDIRRWFDTPLGRPYDRFFVRMQWKQAVRRWQRFPELSPETIPPRPKKLTHIDEIVTAPLGGFDSVDSFYRAASPGPKLESIKQPMTIVASDDDPVVPIAPLHKHPKSSAVETIVTHSGGHLGFIARRSADPDTRWLDWRILEWLQQR